MFTSLHLKPLWCSMSLNRTAYILFNSCMAADIALSDNTRSWCFIWASAINDSMLEKGVIRIYNSTYSTPIWPVLKPNGKWHHTTDYRKLYQQVLLSQWLMMQLDQELPKVRGAMIFSTLDLALRFWTIPVHPEDQHKLAQTQITKRHYSGPPKSTG